jgi:hypothetical protein
MSSSETSTPQPVPPTAFPEGLGRLVLIGMALGVVLVPLAVYLGIDVFGQFGPACTTGGAHDHIACSMRQLIMTGMAVPAGALIGFFISYWIACRRFNAARR